MFVSLKNIISFIFINKNFSYYIIRLHILILSLKMGMLV